MSVGGWRGVPRGRRVLGTTMRLLAVAVLCGAAPAAAQQSNEQAVWKLESAYWDYVKAVDLDGYRDLWHQKLRRLAVLERAAREKGSHHRVDHRAYREGAAAAVVLARARSQSGDREHRDHTLLGDDVLVRQGGPGRPSRNDPDHPHVDQDPGGVADSRRHGRAVAFRKMRVHRDRSDLESPQPLGISQSARARSTSSRLAALLVNSSRISS
jgi:hypothetical protein